MILGRGIGFLKSGGEVIVHNQNSNANNLSFATIFSAVAGSAYAGQTLIIYLANGVTVGSTTQANPALRTSTGWHSSWIGQTVFVGIQVSGTARVQGCGGDGGLGARRSNRRQAGGGGGAGTSVGLGAAFSGDNGTAEAGGDGGPTDTISSGSNQAPVSGTNGGNAIQATASGPNIGILVVSGSTFQIWGGGGGGGGGDSLTSPSILYPGGDGGGPGLSGQDVIATFHGGFTLTTGGLAGFIYDLPGSATISEIGPGTIDKRGR